MNLRVALMFVVYYVSPFDASSVMMWNVDKFPLNNNQQQHVLQHIKPTIDKPLVVFVKDNFNLIDFNKAADVYNPKGNGGSLKHFKEVLDKSRGYTTLNVDSVKKMIKKHASVLKIETVSTIAHDNVQPETLKHSSIVYVTVPDDISTLDSIVPSVLEHFKDVDYVAMLIGRDIKLDQQDNGVMQRRSKRDSPNNAVTPAPVTEDPTPAPDPVPTIKMSEGWILVNATKGNCLLMANNINLVFRGKQDKKTVMTYYTLSVTSDGMVEGNCPNSTKNEKGVVIFPLSAVLKFPLSVNKSEFRNAPVRDGKDASAYWPFKETSDIVVLEMEFNSTRLGDWRMSRFTLDSVALGTKINPTSSLSVISGDLRYGLSCTSPGIFYDNATDIQGVQLGIEFYKLKIQMFNVKNGRFSQTFSDCVGFFSAGAWMGIISMLVYLFVFGFGICMIANLKTMDRFEDPKGKVLVINVRDGGN